MEYELLLDDLLESLSALGVDTSKLNIVEKTDYVDEQEFIIDQRASKYSYTQLKAETNHSWVSASFFI
ncbi:hypothetical protein [Streptococcus uberis]|uniref:hypothetical protein n=1 Tax=Streptococcus uberis TaxID=1349 RepID=UPI0006204C83|nr:hypothetical protein [Streptococcus uberis]KKF41467.1 hypothetical protein AF61_01925 [Streptococcus uberis EF20/0145]QBX12096.1 hypothetical protein JavanS634_0003 [Streptococcus satellite phage Javan634]